ncbi:Aldo/keto reductase (fragment) [uncultured Woeseiaceae bacterium]|uniref:Aldo/keto reductase n=1 Tax=uncultured Woeseiaceae bacterium TaxID=1983305 RepID=A0A7D9H568_9GAMM
MKPTDRPEKFRRWQSTWDHWDKWLCESALTPLQACLRYVAGFSEIDQIVVGVDNQAQLREIYHSLDGTIPSVPRELMVNDIDLVNPARW